MKPKYPDSTGHTVEAGAIVFEAVIDPTGQVCDLTLVRNVKFTPPFPEYVEALREAVVQSTYMPATKDGTPVKFRLTITALVHVR